MFLLVFYADSICICVCCDFSLWKYTSFRPLQSGSDHYRPTAVCINTQIHPLTAWGWAVESGREKGGYGWVHHPIYLLNSLQLCLNSLSGMPQSPTNKPPILSFAFILLWAESFLSWQFWKGLKPEFINYIYWDYNYKITHLFIYTLKYKHNHVLLQTWWPTSILPLLDALSNILLLSCFVAFLAQNSNLG